MKNLLFALLLLGTTVAHAQNTGKYCEIRVYRPGFDKYVASVNYGDKSDNNNNFIKDKDGQKIKFPTRISVVNYMTAQGWVLVSSDYNPHSNETHFYMKKE